MWIPKSDSEKNHYLLILGANQFQRERSLIGAMQAYEGPIITLSENRSDSRYFSDIITGSDTDPAKCLQAVKDYEQKYGLRPVAVVPLNDFVLNAGQHVAEHYNLPYQSARCIEICRNKDLTKEILKASDIPVVPSHIFQKVEELEELLGEIGFPAVIKPRNLGGSGGVKKVHNMDEAKAALEEALNHVVGLASKYNSSEEDFVVEPYIESIHEVSVEVFNYTTNDGNTNHQAISVTDKFLSAEPYFSEIGHLIPSVDHNLTEIHDLAEKVTHALGMTHGMSHVEIKVTPSGGYVVLEAGARPAGDGIMDLLERSFGVNFYKWHSQAYLGTFTKPAAWPKPLQTAALGYLHPNPGVVKEVAISVNFPGEFAETMVRSTVQVTPGERVQPAMNWSTRNGFSEYVFKTPPTHSQFLEMNELASNTLIVTEPQDAE